MRGAGGAVLSLSLTLLARRQLTDSDDADAHQSTNYLFQNQNLLSKLRNVDMLRLGEDTVLDPISRLLACSLRKSAFHLVFNTIISSLPNNLTQQF